MENQLQIDFGDPNDNPDVRNFVLVDGGNGDFNPKDGIIDFEISIDPPHQYLDDQALADRPSPGNDTPFDQFATAMVKDSTSNRTAMTSDFITVNNVDPIIIEVMANSIVIDDDNNNGRDVKGMDDDEEGLLVFIEGTFTDPGSLDIHRGTVAWNDGISTDLEITFDDGFNGTFTTSRFLSEDELEDKFPEINDDDNNFPDENFPGELDDDDIYKLSVNITIEDDDRGMDTKPFEFFVSEE